MRSLVGYVVRSPSVFVPQPGLTLSVCCWHLIATQIRPTAQFGISPFGIWRPGYPQYTTGTSHSRLLPF